MVVLGPYAQILTHLGGSVELSTQVSLTQLADLQSFNKHGSPLTCSSTVN